MHTIGRFIGANRTLDGALAISFEIDDSEVNKLDKLKDIDLVIDIKKYYEKRSLNANNYFWKLCDLIAKALGSDKDTIYLIMLKRYGVWQDVEAKKETLSFLKQTFREVEVFDDGQIIYDPDAEELEETIIARCYLGSSHYDTAQMSYLINGTVNEAKDLNIEVWTQEEIDRLVRAWKGD